MITLQLILLSICSAIMYRSGGLSKDAQEPLSWWIPKWMRHSWVRDWLCPLCFGIFFLPHSWFEFGMWLCYYGATGGMLSTYWDWMFKKDTYWFAGLMVGLAGFFLVWSCPWYIILARALIISLVWHLLTFQKSADVAEYGRGFILF